MDQILMLMLMLMLFLSNGNERAFLLTQVPREREHAGLRRDLPQLPDPNHRPVRPPADADPPLLPDVHPHELLVLQNL